MQQVDPKLTRYDNQVAQVLARLRLKNHQILVTRKSAYIIQSIRNHVGEVISRKIIE